MELKKLILIQAILSKFSKHLALIVIISIAFKSKVAPNVSENLLIAGVILAAILHTISKLILGKIQVDKP